MLCLNNQINIVIPTIDTELLKLSKNKALFKENNIDIIISSDEFIRNCRDKRKTHNLFNNLNIRSPQEYSKSTPIFPLFIKPYDGSRSVDIYFIEKKENITNYHYDNDKLMFLEYIDKKKHTEFTIDLYYDKNSELKCVVPRERIEVRSGEVSKGITRKNLLVDFLFYNMKVVKGARGCLTMQVFLNNNNEDIIGIEINPRFGGGYPLTYKAGGNYSRWIIEEYLLGKKIAICNDWEDNLLMLRYDEEIIVHENS